MPTTAPPLILRRLSRGQLMALDGVLAVAVALLCWYAAIAVPTPPASGWHEPGWVSVLTGVVFGVPVALRRMLPVAATVVGLTAAAVSLATGLIPDFASVAPILAVGVVLYLVGSAVTGWRSIVVAAVSVTALAATLAFAAGSPYGPGDVGAPFAALVLGACWTVGRTMRERRLYAAREAAQATSRAVDEERLRIAREMHDIVAHSMSLIAVKSTIAEHVADERPQEMRDALRVISSTSRQALSDLRRTIGALRPEADLAPAPGLADLPALADAATSAGLAVDLDLQSESEMPDGVGLTAFRIVQEALTNTMKHAHAARCTVDIIHVPGNVRIEIVDDGLGPPGSFNWHGGKGLIGMRERVALYDGDLVAEPGDTGGFEVRATLRYTQ